MTRTAGRVALLSCLSVLPTLGGAAEVRRLALVAGANRGHPDRVPLRYAFADAQRFAGVLTRLGGVAPDDCLTLKDPTRDAFLAAFAALRDRVGLARQEDVRAEVILYYSGHADEDGLMLGRERISYRELRDAMQGIAAEVGITVLDACASGVITRLKGGRPRPAFLTDDSMRMQGHAFLTSSSENEAAQESERLQGSFFTHALVSGLRGAADASGDGRVTLGEAYQFAFQETLAQTTTTQGGAQHPAYDIRMSGTGDVVMTDVRQATAGLILGADLDGRFFVRDGRRRLVAELYKPAGRRAEIAVEPGTYEVQYEEEKELYTGEIVVAEGDRREVQRPDLGRAARTPTRFRGSDGTPPSLAPFADAGRLRLELLGVGVGRGPMSGGRVSLGLLRSLGRSVSLEAGVSGLYYDGDPRANAWASVPIPYTYTWTRTDRSFALWFGGRYYLPPAGKGFRPFLRATIGPVAERKTIWVDGVPTGTYSDGAALGYVGGGVDFRLSRRLTFGLQAGWNLRTEQKPAFRISFGLGFSFGQARPE
jgi:hypothetical protein